MQNESDPKLDILIELMKESSNEFKQLRDSNHAIRDELNKVSGQFMLVRQSNQQEKEVMLTRFVSANERIDTESVNRKTFEVEIKKKVEHIDNVVANIAPKVNRISTMVDWATRIVIAATMSGILWATAQSLIKT